MSADPSYDPSEFQEVLQGWMDRRGLSQSQAGYEIGVSPGIVNRWLKPYGDRYLVQPEVRALEKLAAAPGIGVTILQLKRMTKRLSPDDLAVLQAVQPDGPPDPRLEGLIEGMRDRWRQMADEEREHSADITSTVFRLHPRRPRRPRPQGPQEPDPSPLRLSLMLA